MKNLNTKRKILTDREIEVLKLCTQGFTNKEIAEKLVISAHTAKAHICNILKKLDATSRTQAAVIAEKQNLLT